VIERPAITYSHRRGHGVVGQLPMKYMVGIVEGCVVCINIECYKEQGVYSRNCRIVGACCCGWEPLSNFTLRHCAYIPQVGLASCVCIVKAHCVV
jgi:hypothetical protein